jgi:hypothetical protein
MSNELEKLHIIAFDLRGIGMMQTAGDIDYLVSWLKSPEFNNGVHLQQDLQIITMMKIRINDLQLVDLHKIIIGLL